MAVPDGIWFTWTQLAFTPGIAVVAVVATVVASAIERSQRRLSL